MDKKRFFIVAGFIASVIVFAWLLYTFFFRGLVVTELENVNAPGAPGVLPQPVNGNISVMSNANETISLPDFLAGTLDLDAPTDVARGGLTTVKDYTDRPIEAFTSGSAGAQFYDHEAGQFFRLDGDRPVVLTDRRFFDVETVTWSKDQTSAILEYPDGSNVVYNFETNTQVTLPAELHGFAFSSTGDEIAAKWEGDSDDENWLMVGDAAGTNFQLIEPLGDRAHNVQVDYSPDNQIIATVRKAHNATTQTVIPIGKQGEQFHSFTVTGLNFESAWGPHDNVMIYSVASAQDDFRPRLYLTGGAREAVGQSHLDLTLQTWPSKCAFDSAGSSLYCAVPGELPRGAGLYPEVVRGVPDAFYRIDLQSGQKIPLAVPVGNQSLYSASSVYLSGDESLLYFVDGFTGQLHSIRLK